MAQRLVDIDFTDAIAPSLQQFVDIPVTENRVSVSQIKGAIAIAIAATIGAKNIIELDVALQIVGTKIKVGVKLVADEIQMQIDQLNAEVLALQGNVTTLQGNIATLQGDISTLQGDIGTLQSDIAGLTIGGEVQAWSATLDAIAALVLQPDQLISTNGTGAIALTPKKVEGFAKIEHQLNASLFGGTPLGTKGTWITVPLNQVTTASGHLGSITLSAGRITVPAGTYIIEGRAFGCGVVRFKSRIYNVTSGQELIKGESTGASHDTFVNDATYGSLSLSQVSVVKGRITLAVSSQLELQTICKDFHAFDASLGVKIWGAGIAEITVQAASKENYSSLTLQKVD